VKKKILSLIVSTLFVFSCAQSTEDDFTDVKKPSLFGNRRITFNNTGSKAFTDLVYFNDKWYLTYRDSDSHSLGQDGKIQIFSSFDGIKWTLEQEFFVLDVDLRDPKFSINKDILNICIHGSIYKQSKLVGFKDFISQWSKIGWSNLKPILLDNKKLSIAKIEGNESWPWRFTWFNDVAYVFGYNPNGIFSLYTSSDGINFVSKGEYFQKIGGTPTEATIRINPEGDFYCLIRRNNAFALLIKSTNSGETWETVSEIPISSLGGPNFLFYKNGLILSGRDNNKVVVCSFNLENNKFTKLKTLASGGDCSYPGMVMQEEILWISYYSGHETTSGSSIYLETLNLKNFDF